MRTFLVATCTLLVGACTMISGADDLVVGEAPATASSGVGDGGGAPDARSTTSSSSGGSTSSSSSSGGSTSSSAGGPLPEAGAEAGCTPTVYGPRYAVEAGSNDWLNPLAARVLDGSPAHSSPVSPLVLTRYGFAVPTTATIVGIKVDVARSAVGQVYDSAIALPKGTAKAKNGTWFVDNTTSNFPIETYGGATDTWGATWTASEVNALSFGVAIGVSQASAGDGHVDAVAVTVYACP